MSKVSTKQSDCRFREPYRDPKTRRPHPTKASVCAFPVMFPMLPPPFYCQLEKFNARPTVGFMQCGACACYEKRGLRFHQPVLHAQIEMEGVK
jgi:hypothetical protein